MTTARKPLAILKTYYVATWTTEYKKAYIEAASRNEAERIAEESLRGERSDVEWQVFDGDGGDVDHIEEI